MKPLTQKALAAVWLVFMIHAASMASQELAAAALFEQNVLTKPVLGGGIGGGEDGVEGHAFLLQPLWSTLDRAHGGSILFLQPEVVWRDEGQWFGGLGLGFRHWFEGPADVGGKAKSPLALLLADGWFVGGNVFVDVMQSPQEQTFWQMSGGLEVGTRYVTLRANYYWPLTDEQRYGEVRTVSLSDVQTRVRTRENANYTLRVGPGPTPDISDIRIFQHLQRSFTASSSRLMTTSHFGLYEDALEGWDLEASLLVPWLERYTDLRIIAGYYGFNGGAFSADVEGWRLGMEWRPVPVVVLNSSWYEDSQLRDGQWFAGIGLEIPLGTPLNELFRKHTRTLKERMIEPVHRQRQITLASGSKLERVEVQVVTLSEKNGRSSITIDSGPLQSSDFTHPFFWNIPGGPVPAGTLINAFGHQFQVRADGSLLLLGPAQYYHGIIVAVPEPSRALLVIVGLAFVLLRRRRVVTQ